ncbi:LPXTG cell wall anchor domain-containing protein [Streptococcus didelphis]|nr:LPXTG cell wall anchor domain-containing protein [Streptococcus didelphis]WMB29417.1 LPXTG cell wall anchor domain-containing protein [Streptococcus didelphis]
MKNLNSGSKGNNNGSTAPNANMNKDANHNGQANPNKQELPSTGDSAANPFFTAAAMTVLVGAGALVAGRKRKEN